MNPEDCPVWHNIKSRFPAVNPETICITYFPHIYCKRKLAPDFEAHEQVHLAQQKEYGVEAWWKQYLTNPFFVREQEMEAYRAHGAFIRKHWKGDRNEKVRRMMALARDFSGPIYGNCISFEEARAVIM